MPDYVDTNIVDEDVEAIDLNTDADVIGVSFMTFNAPRAYEIGDLFRAKGKKVIFGGYKLPNRKSDAVLEPRYPYQGGDTCKSGISF